jgi:hypothetical protein
MEDGIRKDIILFVDGINYRMGFPISETDFTHVDARLDSYLELYNMYLKSSDVFNQYKLLYLIVEADPKARNDLALRTIRNMLHHTELDCIYHPDQCRKAEELFGSGVRGIDYSNPDHQRVVQDRLPQLGKIARSIIMRMQARSTDEDTK